MKRLIVIICVAAALIAAGFLSWRYFPKKGGANAYRTATIEQGDVVQTIRASGTVQPVKLVQVGTQVNGPVKKLYVDYNDRVKAGDLVAQIDPTVYEARLAQAEANLTQGLASVDEAKAKLAQADKDLARAKELARRDMLSQSDLDAAVATHDTLAAQVKVTEAGVEQDKASLRLTKADLDYTTIRSPVDGSVIARNVDEGQTVVASMSAQVLYQIATDLRQVQVVASVPEADIGKIATNQPVTFTVDAYDEDFHGKVAQIRLAAATVQNVVTYPVVILADNPDRKLFPGMTANISCEVARRTDVLKVPNAALRFKPAAEAKAPRAAAGGGESRESRGPRGAKVWIQETPGGPPTPVRVKLGISDGSSTELKDAGSLKAGQDVIVGLADTGSATTGPVNPFVPQMPGRGARR